MSDRKKEDSDSPEIPIDETVKEVEEQRKCAERKYAEAEKEIEDGARPKNGRFRL
jgi:hypothetical protein